MYFSDGVCFVWSIAQNILTFVRIQRSGGLLTLSVPDNLLRVSNESILNSHIYVKDES